MACSGQEIQDLAILSSGTNGYYGIVSAVPEFPALALAQCEGCLLDSKGIEAKTGWLDGAPATEEYDPTPNTERLQNAESTRQGVELHARSAQREFLMLVEIGKDPNLCRWKNSLEGAG